MTCARLFRKGNLLVASYLFSLDVSLSSWLRDYLYVSLGGNRRGRSRTAFNLMLTMLLGGLWHGAAWSFVVWGGVHGLLLLAGRGVKALVPGDVRERAGWSAAGLTFLLVCLASESVLLPLRTGPRSWGPMLGPEGRAAVVERLAKAARAIESRGGRAILVRFPSSGAVRAFEEARMPRDQAWDALVRSVAVPGIHFEDHAELRRFVCPDGSHLDASDAAPFTLGLARLLGARLAGLGDERFARPTAPGE